VNSFPWLDVMVFAPLAGAMVLGAIPRDNYKLLKLGALGITIATFGLSLVVLALFDTSEAGFQLGSTLSWVRAWNVHYKTGIDGISLWMIMATTFMMPVSIMAAWSAKERLKPYLMLLLAVQTGILGVFSSLDMFLFYLFWEATLVPLYFLIGVFGGQRRLYATVKFFLYTLAGSLIMLAAIFVLYFSHEPSPTFNYEALIGTPLGLTAQTLLFLGFFASFAIKTPLIPLHTWLPDAHSEAPASGSVDVALVLFKLGPYGFLRFAIPFFPDAARVMAPVVVGMAVAGILYAALVAAVQRDLKRLVAYSTVAHLGFIALGIFVGTVTAMNGSVLQWMNQAISTGALFVLVAILQQRRNTRLIEDFSGLAKSMPVFSGLFLLFALSALGLPGLNNFIGEFLILAGTFFSGYRWWVILATSGTVLAAVYLLWAYQRAFHGPLVDEANRRLADLDLREIAMLAPAVAAMFLVGFYPQAFLTRIQPAAEKVVHQMHSSVIPSSSSALGTGPGGNLARSSVIPSSSRTLGTGPGGNFAPKGKRAHVIAAGRGVTLEAEAP
jgi:NADH-quinone oxidoreductase subunit M